MKNIIWKTCDDTCKSFLLMHGKQRSSKILYLMKIENFIIVGDIHYPTTKKISMLDNKHADEKTNTVPADIDKSALSLVVEKIMECCRQRKISYIVFIGDYTSAGNEAEFRNCLKYFSNALQSTGVPLVGVPGNHDLKRPEDFLKNRHKFKPFIDIAKSNKIEINFSKSPEIKPFGKDINSYLYLINSCHGCQELWKSTDPASKSHLNWIDAILGNFIKLMRDGKGSKNSSDAELYDRFDAPYIGNECSNSVQKHIDEQAVTLPIVIAHHNIFPQRQPRIALFPEMLNAGYIRDLLQEIETPVLYVHGHIHDDPIQVLVDPQQLDKIKLISISAPQIDSGFLEISSGFSNGGHPVATTLRNHKLRNFRFGVEAHIFKFIANKDARNAVLSGECLSLLGQFEQFDRLKYIDIETEFGAELIQYLECIGEISINREVPYEKATWIVQLGADNA